MNTIQPLVLFWRDASSIVRKSLLIALAAFIHVPIALALIERAAAMLT